MASPSWALVQNSMGDKHRQALSGRQRYFLPGLETHENGGTKIPVYGRMTGTVTSNGGKRRHHIKQVLRTRLHVLSLQT
jgi:hypothetical protein